jgi:predicted dienelactone hydrolase
MLRRRLRSGIRDSGSYELFFSMFAKGLAAIIALTLAFPAGAASYAAGEDQRTTTTSSAAIRNHGNGALRITIWYPAAGTEREVDIGSATDPIFIAGRVATRAPFADAVRHPLILASHGFGGTARQLTWLGASLARHGFIVAAVDHPGTNGADGVTPQGAYAPWERASDLKAALDFLLADPKLASHIDARRIGVAGFSLGGFTGALEAGARTDFDQFIKFCNGPSRDAICNPQLEFPLDYRGQAEVLARPEMRDLRARENSDFRDPRITAAFLIAPALVQAFDFATVKRIHIPVEIVLGSADPIAPPGTNGELLARLIPGARLKVFPAVGHYDFLSECGPAGAKEAAAYCTDGVGTKRADTHASTVAAAIEFFDGTIGRRH